MRKCDDGGEINAGDKIWLTVGIPGREVSVMVKKRRGRLVVEDCDGSMSLSAALKFFHSRKSSTGN